MIIIIKAIKAIRAITGISTIIAITAFITIAAIMAVQRITVILIIRVMITIISNKAICIYRVTQRKVYLFLGFQGEHRCLRNSYIDIYFGFTTKNLTISDQYYQRFHGQNKQKYMFQMYLRNIDIGYAIINILIL